MTTSRFPTPRRLAATTACTALLVSVAACDGDDVATPRTVPNIPVPSTTRDTFFETATTTIILLPSTTEPTTTSTAPTTMPSTTPETTATTVPSTPVSTVADPEVQAVVDASARAWSAFNELLLDPLNDSKLDVVRDAYAGAALQRVLETVEDFRLQGLQGVENAEVPARAVQFSETAVIDGSTAKIEYCWVNSNLLIEPGGGENGSDRVIDDSVSVVRSIETFELEDDRWVKVKGTVLRTVEEVTSCDAVR